MYEDPTCSLGTWFLVCYMPWLVSCDVWAPGSVQPSRPYGLGLGGGVLRCPYLARNYSYWCLIDWCPRLHALMSAWLLISRLHFTPFVCIFIYMHMFVDFAVLDYFDYGSRDCYFWSFDTFSYFAVRQHCASWDWTITCSILSFRICVVSHRLDIVIAIPYFTCHSFVIHYVVIDVIHFIHDLFNPLIPHLCGVSQIAQSTLVLSSLRLNKL